MAGIAILRFGLLISIGLIYPICYANEALASVTYFYAGGHYEKYSLPGTGAGTRRIGQIYVEKLTPKNQQKRYPLVFIPGAGQTGASFLNTPDGREGWASYFLRKGYTIYLTDVPQRGRSPWDAVGGGGSLESIPAEYEERYFVGTQNFKPPEWPQAGLLTQFPGTGLIGDPIFDAFYATQVQLQVNNTICDAVNKAAYDALLDKIGPAVLVTHSQSGPYGFVTADSRPKAVKGIIAIEPEGPPFVNETGPTGPPRIDGVTRLPLLYDPPVINIATDLKTVRIPPPADKKDVYTACTLQADHPPPKKLVNLAGIPVVLLTGEASYHAPYDYCTIAFLKQAGLRSVEWLDLGSRGIHGNGHFLYLEKNNLEIALLVLDWLKRHVD